MMMMGHDGQRDGGARVKSVKRIVFNEILIFHNNPPATKKSQHK